ncbi:MAG: RNA-binding domain-containing protein [Saccharofermentanales bacterium]|jgi:ATP-dependent DNA helicase RecG|nr:putative DNA binding domain-containing protein [Bacillota bacterium]
MTYLEKENASLELKAKLSDSFLKTVSAYANYSDGKIVFGVSNDGTIIGISDEKKLRLQIENKINDCITPRPQFKMEKQEVDGKVLIVLSIFKGKNAPYYYNQTTYKRTDTSTTPVDRSEIRHLVLTGVEQNYDQLISPETELEFTILEKELKREIGLKRFSDDTLRTLGLVVDDEYTRAAELLADKNKNPRSATSIVRFGKTRSEFMDRKDLTYQSLLTQYKGALGMFDKWYAPYEEVVDFRRIERIQIPREAYREGVANALINRRYDINGSVQVAMYEDRIEIISPGGLPEGMNETAYLYKQISIPRNTVVANVFHRLHIIEKFGTGIDRIRDEYVSFPSQPEFEITSDFIRVVLPVIDYDNEPQKPSFGESILLLLSKKGALSRAEIEEHTGFKRSWVLKELNRMLGDGIIEVAGKGPATRYRIK